MAAVITLLTLAKKEVARSHAKLKEEAARSTSSPDFKEALQTYQLGTNHLKHWESRLEEVSGVETQVCHVISLSDAIRRKIREGKEQGKVRGTSAYSSPTTFLILAEETGPGELILGSSPFAVADRVLGSAGQTPPVEATKRSTGPSRAKFIPSLDDADRVLGSAGQTPDRLADKIA